VPLTDPVKFMALVCALLHKIWLTGCVTFEPGFTVMVTLCVRPVQPLAKGVIMIVAVTGALVVLIAVKEEISPDPFAARPIEVLLFVQL